MALAKGTVVGNDSSIRISNPKNMFFLRFYHLRLIQAGDWFNRPAGTGAISS